MKYDVVIIGGGLGGLECGVMLSREGYNVCVLEKNPVIGGCLQTFSRQGYALDTGIHYVGSLDPGQILHQYFRYFGVMDSLKLKRMDEEAFDTVLLGNRLYDFGMGYDRFADNLTREFPKEKENIAAFSRLLQRIGGTISVENLRKGFISLDSTEYLGRSAYGTIAESFGDETLRQVVAGTSALYAGVKEKTTLYHYGMINHSFIESSYRFVNGSQQLADALAAQIRKQGGTVLTGKEATLLRVRDSRIAGVEVNGGEEYFEADQVISSLHPARTFDLTEKTSQVKKAYLTRLHSLENSYAIFSVYLLMKKGSAPYHNRNFYLYDGNDAWNTLYDPDRDRPRLILFNMQAGPPDQQYADVISLMSPIAMDPFRKWGDTTVNHRGRDYRDFKDHLAERMVDFMSEFDPGIRDSIEHVHATTPLTYRDYTATPDGSAYGIVKDYRSPLTTLIPVSTRFENLLLTGQNMNVHGALGVTVTAALTCAKLLGSEYLAKKIGDA